MNLSTPVAMHLVCYYTKLASHQGVLLRSQTTASCHQKQLSQNQTSCHKP
jgi:hypothetical protein